MMYDSIRQAKPAIRNNFGVGRFNTRLNFYFYEINRLSFIQRKSFHNHRYNRATTLADQVLSQYDEFDDSSPANNSAPFYKTGNINYNK